MFAIKVENLSKAYKIKHTSGAHRYKTLQDAILNIPRNIFKKKSSDEIFLALNNVSFEVNPGDRIGIIGRNGAGKSTLLKVLSRITEPSGGRVLINGRVGSLLEVGTGFHPELTGRENVFMNGAILGMSRAEITAKFDEIVEFAEVEKFIDTPVKRYSSGMYVRLAFAVAAHLEPEILLVDEVLAVGDSQFQKKCLGKMEDVSKKDGRTILFVSHNMTAVKTLCSKAIHLTHGTPSPVGEVEHIINQYLTEINNVQPKNDNTLFENNTISLNCVNAIESVLGRFKINEPLTIEVSLTNKCINDRINVNIFFNAPEGGTVFVATSNLFSVPIGSFKVTCHIPANFLNDNSYCIDLMAVVNGEKVIANVQNVLILEGLEPVREGAWMGKFPGFIRPTFRWDIKYGE
jgi:lipopolysaccharide transport system ATP-binding protein